MNDLELWQRLSALEDETDLDGLARLIANVPHASWSERIALLGFAPTLLAHTHAPLRVAAIGMLQGTEGHLGVERIVAALDDEDARVRAEAVRVLRTCCARAPKRWAHAIFHPRIDVRRLALETDTPTTMAKLGAYLRADPQLAAQASQAPWPEDRCALIFDLLLRGHLDDTQAAEAFRGVKPNDLRQVLRRSIRRRLDPVINALEGFVEGKPLQLESRDLLDLWCRLIWANPDEHRSLIIPMAHVCLGQKKEMRYRLAYALLAHGQTHGHLPEALQAAIASYPALMASPLLTVDERRIGSIGLRLYRTQVSRFPALLPSKLLHDQELMGRGSDIDLSLAALIASFQRRAVSTLIRIFGEYPIICAAIEQPQAWSTLRELHDEADGGPLWFFEHIHAHDPSQGTRFVAEGIMLWRSQQAKARKGKKNPPPTLLDRLIARLDGPMVARVLTLLVHSPDPPDIKAFGRLLDQLEPLLREEDVTDLFSRLLPNAEWEIQQFVLHKIVHRRSTEAITRAITELDTASLHRFALHAHVIVLQRSKERALAEALQTHHDAQVSAWALQMLASFEPKPTTLRLCHEGMHALDEAQIEAIRTAHASDFVASLGPALRSPCTGLCKGLRGRKPPERPSPEATVALFGCGDRLSEVSEQLERFGSLDEDFRQSAAVLAVSTWQGNDAISPLGHAWLSNWEQHKRALLEWLDELPGGLAAALRATADLGEALARQTLWRGITFALLFRRYRQGARLRSWGTAEVVDVLIAQLDTDLGPFAARMLATLHSSNAAPEHLEAQRERAVMMAPDMDRETRRELERWIKIDGLQARTTPARIPRTRVREDRLNALRTCTDLDVLSKHCASPNGTIANEAVLRMIELGEPGEIRLATLLETPPSSNTMRLIAESLALWSEQTAIDRIHTLVGETDNPHHRFCIAIGLLERGETRWATPALQAAAAPSDTTWLTLQDLKALSKAVPDMRVFSVALARSVHPHAYQRAVRWLLEEVRDDGDEPSEKHEDVLDALAGFLWIGAQRPLDLRRAAARKLLRAGRLDGLVVLLSEALDPSVDFDDNDILEVLGTVEQPIRTHALAHLTEGTLLSGASEDGCFTLATRLGLPAEAAEPSLRRLLTRGTNPVVRERLVNYLQRPQQRNIKLNKISEIFAWGVRRGRDLTSRLFRVHMTERRQDLGYTRMNENTIYVSPLPVLAGDRHGRDVVEALILHEFGHHLYHRDELSQKVWARAQAEGIGSVLNLVADEHLERRLRAMDVTYGNRLKRLAAYAFQHSEREVRLDQLLAMLLGSAFEALSVQPLRVAFDDAAVVIDSGLVLRQLDKHGHPYARFVRALRMGLGDRHDDPRLRTALALFKGGFRHLDMEGLYQIARTLAEMYGTQSELSKCFGGHESLEWDERGSRVHSDGLNDRDVQQEVERILEPPRSSSSRPSANKPSKLMINVSAKHEFPEIDVVEPMKVDVESHRSIAAEVRRHAMRLRSYFAQMGLAHVPRRARLRGRAFDRTRARAVVIRRDPRMLVARELEVRTDLFIGVVVDCSGSMSTGGSMDKAHRFGVLLAEAARGLQGVDARFFGFTDSRIYDAGTEDRCAVSSLAPGGGNNDAAGLLHAASVASGSRRRAKLLIMISDGLPTECSVEALRNLVQQLARRKGILCAQVAVRALEEVCFPHYVELTEDELDRSVRRFGEIISGLAARAIGR